MNALKRAAALALCAALTACSNNPAEQPVSPEQLFYWAGVACGLFVAYLRYSLKWPQQQRNQRDANLWRVTEAMKAQEWWYVLNLSVESGVDTGTIYSTLYRLESMARVEVQRNADARARYRLTPQEVTG